MRRIIFSLVLISILGSITYYTGWRLIGPAPLPVLGKAAAWVILFTLLGAYPLSFLLSNILIHLNIQHIISWSSLFSMGYVALLLTLSVIRDAIILLLMGVNALYLSITNESLYTFLGIPQGDQLLNLMNLTVLGGAFLLVAYGYSRVHQMPQVKEVDILVEDLPPELEGYRIAQLSDIHVGPTIKAPFLRKVVEATNQLEADIIALTGDIVDGPITELLEDARPLSDLKAKEAVYLCTGNHDYYSDARAWVPAFRDLGLDVLLNEHRIHKHGQARLMIAGVPDYSAGAFIPEHTPDAHKAMAGGEDAHYKILLAHQPRAIKGAAEAGFDLQLSGHTHGGQFWPIMKFVKLQQPFVDGLHRVGKTQIYISNGTGYWGPPIRIGAPSEITLITLKRGT